MQRMGWIPEWAIWLFVLWTLIGGSEHFADTRLSIDLSSPWLSLKFLSLERSCNCAELACGILDFGGSPAVLPRVEITLGGPGLSAPCTRRRFRPLTAGD
jgi:hypothetical protein